MLKPKKTHPMVAWCRERHKHVHLSPCYIRRRWRRRRSRGHTEWRHSTPRPLDPGVNIPTSIRCNQTGGRAPAHMRRRMRRLVVDPGSASVGSGMRCCCCRCCWCCYIRAMRLATSCGGWRTRSMFALWRSDAVCFYAVSRHRQTQMI